MRKYFIIGAIAIATMAFLASVAAVEGSWAFAIILTQGSLIATVFIILMSTRYIARQARTDARNARTDARNVRVEEHKTRSAIAHLNDRVEESIRADLDSHRDLLTFNQSLHSAIADASNANEKSAAAMNQRVDELNAVVEKGSRSSSRHVTSTVRDSTRQIEALTQIYARFPELKLPMPSTGGFAIDAQALGHLISLVEERRPRKILELGSGTSTIWFGYLSQRFDGEVVSLDHLEEYLTRTRTAVDRHHLNDQVECRLAPLEPIELDGSSFQWYSHHALEDLSDIDLVLIDGPPAATGPQARYPALPQIIDFLSPRVTVILDDAHRDEEANIVAEWQRLFPDFKQIECGTSRLAVLERQP